MVRYKSQLPCCKDCSYGAPLTRFLWWTDKKVKLPFEHFFSQGHQMSGPIVSNLICFHNFPYTKTSSAALWKTRNSLRAFRVLVFFWFWQKTLSSFFQCQLASFLANWGLFLQGKYGSKKTLPCFVLKDCNLRWLKFLWRQHDHNERQCVEECLHTVREVKEF